MLSVNATADELQKKEDQATDDESKTLLDENGSAYTKQAKKHAQQSQCPHVAIFNWNHLLLYGFPLGSNEETKKERKMLTWVTEAENLKEGGKKGNKTESKTAGKKGGRKRDEEEDISEGMEVGYMRRVLLGWLRQAFKDHLGPVVLSNEGTSADIEGVINGLGKVSL